MKSHEFELLKEVLLQDKTIEEINFEKKCVQADKIFVHDGIYAMSTHKLNSLKRIAACQKYYQNNPVRFIQDWFGITLLDAQAWIVQNAWVCPNTLLVCSRGFGKSTIIDILIMAKGMLFNAYWSFIASGTGSQAEQTFQTLERLANGQNPSFVGSTGEIFKNEVVVNNASGDGFVHASGGHHYSLWNNSSTTTLNGNVDRRRGQRGRILPYLIAM